MDNRIEGLQKWIEAVVGQKVHDFVPLSNDASPRRYFALPKEGIVAVDTPLPMEQNHAFITIAKVFAEHGLNVPHVFRYDLEQGYMLVSDLGRRLYLSELNAHTVEKLYNDALNALDIIQSIPLEAFRGHAIPAFDDTYILREVGLWQEWFVQKLLGIELTTKDSAVLQDVYSLLAENNAQQPKVLVHRDYHSRNLMVCEHDNPGIIDFQDAVWGPITYDAVSLLRDCYITWPNEQVDAWVARFQQKAQEDKHLPSISAEQFLRWFDLSGLQRHLKAIGIFARLDLLYKKPRYLNDIPRTLHYVMHVCKRYPELRGLLQFMEEKVLVKLPSPGVVA